ncbi:MAG TPA: chromate transporter [Sphaerochaeta sp.]|jgi:chromate transporter|nr:chromate transporter [Sphaerochaeta sp.]
MIYLQLFLSFIQVGLFSIGGGYAAIPLIEGQVVTNHAWLTMSEFTDLVTIAEMTPGPIAVNSATFVGIRIGGILGAVIATFGCILPSLFLVSILAFVYYKYRSADFMQKILKVIRPVVVSLIAAAGIRILMNVAGFGDSMDWKGVTLFAVALVSMKTTKINPILIMVACGVVYLILGIIFPGAVA